MSNNLTTDGLVSLDKFLEDSGLSHVTGWRYRQRGWIKCINLAGRWYVERAEITRFMDRARAGEFAKEPSRPRRKGGTK